MSQPVKLSDPIVLDARLIGQISERSIAGQIEYWANLGRAVERLLRGEQSLALCRSATTRSLSDCLDSVDKPQGRQRVVAYLNSQPYPHYEPAPGAPGLLVRIEANGKRTMGRFVRRTFRAVRSSRPRS